MAPQRPAARFPPPGGQSQTAFSPEAAQFAELAIAAARGAVPMWEVIARLDNRNVPPQLKQTPFMATLASATDTPKLLIPENRNRMSFLLAYIDAGLASPSLILFSYGGRPAPNVGLPLASADPYGESNGTISIDEIWIHPLNNVNNHATYPIVCFGYEGSLAIESHLHAQTLRVAR